MNIHRIFSDTDPGEQMNESEGTVRATGGGLLGSVYPGIVRCGSGLFAGSTSGRTAGLFTAVCFGSEGVGPDFGNGGCWANEGGAMATFFGMLVAIGAFAGGQAFSCEATLGLLGGITFGPCFVSPVCPWLLCGRRGFFS